MTLPSPQGWTDTEAAATWGAAQQVSGPSPCSLGLEDVEMKAPRKPQGSEAEAPRKVIGPSTCQSTKGRDKGEAAQKVAEKGELVLHWAGPVPCENCLFPAPPSSLPLPA